MDARERILGALPDAELPERFSEDLPGGAPLDHARLWEAFQARVEALGGRCVPLEAVAALEGPFWVDDDAAERCGLRTTAEDVWSARVGITMAECAIAATGSVVLQAGPGKARLGALAPPVHVVLVPADRLVGTLAEGLLGAAVRTAVIATGPSRTADIGGVLVRGVHGPGEVIVVRVEAGG